MPPDSSPVSKGPPDGAAHNAGQAAAQKATKALAKGRKPFADYLAVGIQALLLLLLVWRPEFVDASLGLVSKYAGWALLLCGLVVAGFAALGLGRSLSPFPSPKAHAALVTEGLYARVRHPIYTGLILAAFGWTLLGFAPADAAERNASGRVETALGDKPEVPPAGEARDPYRLMVCLSLVVLFQWKAGYEERKLLQRYAEYAGYMARTGRFLPLFGRVRGQGEEAQTEEGLDVQAQAAERPDARPKEGTDRSGPEAENTSNP